MALEFVNDKEKVFFNGLDGNPVQDGIGKSERKSKSKVFIILLIMSAVIFAVIYANHAFMTSYKEGDILKIGKWPSENNGTAEPVEWVILDKDISGTAILITRYGIDSRPYGEKRKNTWEDSTIRQWLNEDFYGSAFDEDEKNAIILSKIKNEDSLWETEGGNDTEDRVFLFSFEEAGKYFKTDKDRQTKATQYTKGKGASAHGSGMVWWWLRTPGRNSYNAACVYSFGRMGDYGYGVHKKAGAVRPAMRISLKKLKNLQKNK